MPSPIQVDSHSTMYDDILVPTDGSDTIPETLAHALPIAADNDATVHGLYVVDSRVTAAADDETSTDLERSLETEGEEAVAAVEERATDEGLETVAEIRQGTPSKTILEYAEEQGIDLIVIGTRGKSPREKVTSLGSVSERVVDNASIPVFVVRNAGEE
ncbi:universal stress protein (plasmid) [Natrinema thermotolerans]|nr:universal stress protein [Natrinema thermotolerans]QCC61567.1 universal stress protein [Natrinema thermotolerans]